MGGRFVHWSKIANVDRSRNCPICGGNIEYRMYPEEVAARILTIVAVIAAAYWANERRGGYLAILVTFALTLAAVYLVVSLLLKNRQRFRKNVIK